MSTIDDLFVANKQETKIEQTQVTFRVPKHIKTDFENVCKAKGVAPAEVLRRFMISVL